MTTKEVEKKTAEKVESAKSNVQLDPAILAAIQETVTATVTSVLKQITPPAPQATVQQTTANAVPPAQSAYKSKLQGIPVEAGQDLRHVPAHRIKAWFKNLETRWKENYAKRAESMTGGAVGLTVTEGAPMPFHG